MARAGAVGPRAMAWGGGGGGGGVLGPWVGARVQGTYRVGS